VITPDGKTLYVVNAGSERVSVIDTATNQVAPIKVGSRPVGIAITPDGKTAYVANAGSESVSVIDTATNQASPSTIKVGIEPGAIVITPDGKHAYVVNGNAGSESVSVIDTATNQASPSAISLLGTRPFSLAITPNQPPVASLRIRRARPGVPVSLDASASKDPDGAITAYAFAFGDKHSVTLASPKATHTYKSPGTYRATVTLTDNEGCSILSTQVFTGQTAMGCKGSVLSRKTIDVKVAYPGVKVRCPKSAKPKGCKFSLQAITKAKKGKALSAVAKAKAKAGRSTIVSLKAKPAFRKKLALAKKVLVKETVRAKGSTRTRVAKLKIVR
jgi:YVTN family beta-propeller protein